MNCKKCVYCVQSKRNSLHVVCKNRPLLKKLGLTDEYEKISEPCFCTFYKTKRQYIKEEIIKE